MAPSNRAKDSPCLRGLRTSFLSGGKLALRIALRALLLLLAVSAPARSPVTTPDVAKLKQMAQHDPTRPVIFHITLEESAQIAGDSPTSWSIKGDARYALLPAWAGRDLRGIDAPGDVAKNLGAQGAVTAEDLFKMRGGLLSLKPGEILQFYVKKLESEGRATDGNGNYAWTETIQDGLWRFDAKGGMSSSDQREYADIPDAELLRTPTGANLKFIWKINTVGELGAGANQLGFTSDEVARILTFRLSEEDLSKGGLIRKTNQGTIHGEPGDDISYPVNLRATLIIDIKVSERKPKLSLNDRSWLPTDDNKVQLTLTCEDCTPTKVKFQIAEVSQEKGTCLNSKDENTEADIEFDPSNTGNGYTLGDKSAEKNGNCGRDETISLHARDWGAWCRVRAQAEIDGRWVEATVAGGGSALTVPVDEDHNRIGDAWQEEMGIPNGLAPNWDEADMPAGQYSLGDGIGLYEKYRGFVLEGKHERLLPRKKHIFVHDPTGLVHQVENGMAKDRTFAALTQLALRYVKEGEWSGPGSSSENRRVVNKNGGWGHVGDQHALHVEWDKNEIDHKATRYPLPPVFAQWREAHGNQSTANVQGSPAYAFPDTANRLGGTPKDTMLILVWDKVVLKHVLFGAVLGQAALVAQEKYGENAMLDQIFEEASEGAKRVVDFAEAHPDQVEMAYRRLLQHVVVHEMLHAANVRHCGGKADPRCVMNVPAFTLNPMQAAFGSSPINIIATGGMDDDPFGLNKDWPDRLCERCFKSIAVSDDSSPTDR